jgi:hypothetical protein
VAVDPSYTLRVPFKVQPGYAFGSTGVSSEKTFGNLSARLDQAVDGYVVTVTGFPSSQSAEEFLPRVWTGLATLMVERGSAFSGSLSPGTVTSKIIWGEPASGSFFASPSGNRVDGIADGDLPTVFPSEKHIRFVSAGQASGTLSLPVPMALDHLVHGFQLPSMSAFEDERVRTSVDLYSAALFEESEAAKLLTLSMAMEVLAPVSLKHNAVVALIAGWATSIEQAKANAAQDPDAIAAIESFEKEVLWKKETSIRQRIRNFVVTVLGNDSNARLKGKDALSAYDARSELLHEGHLDRRIQAESVAKFMDVLKSIYRVYFNGNPEART